MWYWYVLAIWIIGAVIAWFIIKKWNNPMSEKIYFTLVWPLIIPLFIIHYFHNIGRDNESGII